MVRFEGVVPAGARIVGSFEVSDDSFEVNDSRERIELNWDGLPSSIATRWRKIGYNIGLGLEKQACLLDDALGF